MSAPTPKFPDPTQISEIISKQSAEAMDLLNAQTLEASTILGLPSLPVLPKFTLPALPPLPTGGPTPLSMFGQGTRTRTRAEETIKTPYTPAKTEEIIA